MQRYFCFSKENDVFTLSDNDTYHITKVMRYSIGDNIEIVYNNKLFIASIVNVSPLVKAKIIKQEENSSSSYCVTIAQSLVKEQKMDYILQKGTELGASSFIPITTIRSIVKLDDKENKKIVRWNAIVKEASEQSKRVDIPVVMNVHTVKELSTLDYDYKILCSVNEQEKNIKTVFKHKAK